MIGLAQLLLIVGLVMDGGPALARSNVSDDAKAVFASAVQDYRSYVTPICAGEMVRVYISYNLDRDSRFFRSLKGTGLEPVYRQAVRDKVAEVARTVYECEGPPPPRPPASASRLAAPSLATPITMPIPVSRRRAAITRAQERLRTQADEMPGFFDAGDAAFATLVATRNSILALRERP